MKPFRFQLITIARALHWSQVFTLGQASLAAYLKERDIPVSIKTPALPLHLSEWKQLHTEPYKRPELFSWIFPMDDEVEYPPEFLHAVNKATSLLQLWVEAIRNDPPSAIGISVFSRYLIPSILLLRLLKARFPEIPVILGGPACTRSNARLLCDKGLADMVVVGEGEETLAALLKQLRDGTPLSPTPGSFVRIGEEVIDGGMRPLLDINTLPVPDFGDLLHLEGMQRGLPVAFNRGCNFACDFCNERKFWFKFRQMEPEKAAGLMQSLHERYGISQFLLSQSLMNGDMPWLREFSRTMQEKRLPYHWGGNTRVHPKMDEAFWRDLYAGGCRACLFGIESGSDPILKSMKKGTNATTCKRVIRHAFEAGIWVHTYWIFGFPGEGVDDLLQSVDFLIENLDAISSFRIMEYNGTYDPNAVNAETMVDYIGKTSIYQATASDFFEAHSEVLHLFVKMLNECGDQAEVGDNGIVTMFVVHPTPEQAALNRKRAPVLLRLLKRYLENEWERESLAAYFTRERLTQILLQCGEASRDEVPEVLVPAVS